jgi:GT2 family glycosyltransferase
MDISIIIVNYNTKSQVDSCLTSIYEKTKDVNFEIILVDNASTDGSQDLIKNKYPNVILIESQKNLGFGKANNLGINISKGKYLFLLNSDTQLLLNSTKIFYDFFEKNSFTYKIGCLGGWLYENNNYIINENTFPLFRIELKKIIKIYINKFYSIKQREDNNLRLIKANSEFFEVDYICGANLFVLKKVLDQIGVFDERFFMFYEETDLQKRMDNQGFKRLIINESIIKHESGASFKNKEIISSWKRKITIESMLKYFYKHYPSYQVIAFQISLIILYIPIFFNFSYSFSEKLDFYKTLIKYHKT